MTVRLTANPKAAPRYTPKTAGEKLFRKLDLNGEGLEAKPGSLSETLTVVATVASQHPVKRRDRIGPYLEILLMAGCRFKASDDWPLQLDHSAAARETVGRAHSLRVEGDRLVAQLRFSVADDVAPIVQRVADGSLKHLSVGYAVHRWQETVENGQRIKTAMEWSVIEISLTPIPADPNATIHRSGGQMDPEHIEVTPAERRTEIRAIGRAAGMTVEDIDDMIDREIDATAARAEAFEFIQERQRSTPRIRVASPVEDPSMIVTRRSDAVAFRMGGLATLPDASREFMGLSLLDLARDSLTRSGVAFRGLSPDEVFQRAAHGTSDFPLVVSNAANKTLLESYKAAESPLKQLARQRTLPNFKESAAIRLGGMGRLEALSEHGEITATSRGETGEKLALTTFARRFDLSRQLMIDDDLGAFGDIVAALGQAAAQTEADLLVAALVDNVALSDGTAVFHVSRGNLAAGALSEASLSAARLAMRQRKDVDGKTLISVPSKYLLVGPELETQAEKLLASIYAATTDDVQPIKLTLLVEPRIEGDDWYVFADPARVPALQYAYLSGSHGPQIQRQEAWNTLGVSYRCFEDFGAGWLDWRAAQKSTGE